MAPGSTRAEEDAHFLGAYKDLENGPVVEGPARVGEPQISPAQKSALMCEKQIHDQLVDTNAVTVIRKALFEGALLGTSIIKCRQIIN